MSLITDCYSIRQCEGREINTIYTQDGTQKDCIYPRSHSSVTQNRVGSFIELNELNIDIPDDYVKEGVYHGVGTTYETQRNYCLKNADMYYFPDDFSCIGGLMLLENLDWLFRMIYQLSAMTVLLFRFDPN